MPVEIIMTEDGKIIMTEQGAIIIHQRDNHDSRERQSSQKRRYNHDSREISMTAEGKITMTKQVKIINFSVPTIVVQNSTLILKTKLQKRLICFLNFS